ncbi:MAG: PQQ-dependent sugar dehydrogenase [Planctomycetes bacterium]|nr:PQQ-dependent sugar dehydrogenase [Planctomycetota bacterium]
MRRLGFLCCGLLVGGTLAAQIPTGDLTIALTPVAGGFTSPLLVTHAGDGSGRLFVVDQAGQIWVIVDGEVLPDPFLDLSSAIVPLNGPFDERGLLGMAFHPDYANNGRFFVRYSRPRVGDPSEPCSQPGGISGCHEEVLSQFLVSADPNVADPLSEVELFAVDEPQFNHNAGDVHFGPDGYLYFSLGDGGGGNDGLADTPPSHGPIGNGQNIETALGSLLRIDVDSGTPYAIPPDNPFVGAVGLDEIYAYGFRNPYRFSFDAADGTLYLADVGQGLFEEIDVVVNGGNFGWVIREGAHCFDPFDPTVSPPTCPDAGLIDPIAEYDHSDGLAVIGGSVYRGSRFPELVGKYVFGDFSVDFGPSGRLFYLDTAGVQSDIFEFRLGSTDSPLGFFLKGFGTDEDGEIYVCIASNLGPTGTTGQVVRLGAARDFIRGDTNGDGVRDIADVIVNLQFLFVGGAPICLDAHDVDDDGALDLADPIYDLNAQFQSGPPPPAPSGACGPDPTSEPVVGGDFGCEQSSCP